MEKNPPLVTTVIPTYKRPFLLKRAIQSVLDQSFSQFQLYIYDNASEDGTAAIVEEMAKKDQRIHYFCHPQTIPAAENLHFGLSQVETPFFSILSDDDLLGREFYEIALTSLKAFPQAAFFLGSTIDIRENGKVVGANALFWKEEYFLPPHGIYPLIKSYFNWTGSMFRREILRSVHIDSTIIPIDFDFLLKSAALFPFVISKKPCALFISSPHSQSVSSGSSLVWPSWLKILNNLENLLASNRSEKVQRMMKSQLKKFLLKDFLMCVSNNKIKEARQTIHILKETCSASFSYKIASFLLFLFQQTHIFSYLVRFLFFLYGMRRWWVRVKYKKFVRKTLQQHLRPL